MNALKHGLRSKKVEMMTQDSYAFENRLNKWLLIGDAQSDVDEYLIFRNVSLSFDVDRAGNARFQRCKSLIENSDEVELTEIQELGARLFFFEPAGPTPLFGNQPTFAETKKTSWNREAVNPNDPAVLVRKIEGSEAGVRFLCDCWQALRRQLALPNFWQSQDRLKAIRLLGRNPVDNEDRRVAEIFVASHGLNPVRKNEFDDLLSDLDEDQRDRFRKALVERWPDLFRARDKAECRQILLDLVDRNIERLNAKLEVHEANANAVAEETVARLNFDPSPEGVALRNQQMKSLNALFRGMENYRKHKRRAKGRGKRAGGGGRQGSGPDSSQGTGYNGEEGYGSECGPDRSFAGEDGQEQRLEPRVDYSDWVAGAAESNCGTDLATASIPPNETNEANFDETMLITQEQSPVEVVANSVAQSGLDNSVIQPGEAGEPDQEEVRKPASEIGNANWQNAEWADCPGAAAAAELSTPDQRDEVQNRNIEANLGDGHLARQHPVLPAISEGEGHLARQHPVLPANSEGDGHLARQHPVLPAISEGDGHLARQHPVLPANSEGDGHLARQHPVLPAISEGEGHLARQEPVLPVISEGDGHLARQEPVLPALSEGDGHLARQHPVLPVTSEGDGHLTRQHPVLPANSEGDGHLARQQPVLPVTSEGDGHLARQQPDLGPNSEGDGHLARQQPVVPANANSPPGHHSPDHAQNRDNDAFSSIAADREREDSPSSSGQILSAGLHGQVMRELRRRELAQNQKDGFRRSDPRSRRAVGSRDAQAFRKPQDLEFLGDSPILAPLPSPDFSRVLADVHREFEQEFEKPENKPRSIT